MAKKNDAEDDSPKTPSAENNDAGEHGDSESDEPKRPGGRTIARWKQQVFGELPQGNDQEIAERMNQVAVEEGYDYKCSPAAIARWRQADAAARKPGVPGSGEHDEGHAIVVLRQLVYLLGKDGVKRLVDAL